MREERKNDKRQRRNTASGQKQRRSYTQTNARGAQVVTLDLYSEKIIDHYKKPRNFGKLDHPDSSASATNERCGDVVEIQLKMKGDRIERAMFNGIGCTISQAAASIVTELLAGKTRAEAMKMDKQTIADILKVPLGPSRTKCAMLILDALHKALRK
jgi:nitrogen fixation NifU-like protein